MEVTVKVDTQIDGLEAVENLVHADELRIALSEILSLFRQKLKYEELTDEVYDALDQMRDEIYEIVQDRLALEL